MHSTCHRYYMMMEEVVCVCVCVCNIQYKTLVIQVNLF